VRGACVCAGRRVRPTHKTWSKLKGVLASSTLAPPGPKVTSTGLHSPPTGLPPAKGRNLATTLMEHTCWGSMIGVWMAQSDNCRK
jgi:hypothetical protein